jgi:hypothetical protein
MRVAPRSQLCARMKTLLAVWLFVAAGCLPSFSPATMEPPRAGEHAGAVALAVERARQLGARCAEDQQRDRAHGYLA